MFLRLGLLVIAIRVAFTIVFGGGSGHARARSTLPELAAAGLGSPA